MVSALCYEGTAIKKNLTAVIIKKKRDFEMGAHFANYTMYYPYEYEGFDYDGNYVTDFDKFHIDKEEECLN
jgi:hypothetical protein